MAAAGALAATIIGDIRAFHNWEFADEVLLQAGVLVFCLLVANLLHRALTGRPAQPTARSGSF